MFLGNGAKGIQRGKKVFSVNFSGSLAIHIQKISLTLYVKNNLKCTTNLNIRPQTINLVENIHQKLHDTRFFQ